MTRVMNDAPPPPTLDSGMAVRLRENSIFLVSYEKKKKIKTTVTSRAWKSIRNKNLLLLFITIIIINIVVVHLYS